MHKWNSNPKIKGEVFFDDFSDGISPEIWDVAVGTWDKISNGLKPENVLVSTDAARVKAEGATGGIVVIKSNGDFQADPSERRKGGLLITRKAYGAGLFEARMKTVPRSGQCTALWTYWANKGKDLETNLCSEIDIELPSGADFRAWEGTIYSKYVSYNEKVAKSNKYISECGGLNDGKWHDYAFEWRTNEATGDVGVAYYVDGKEVGFVTGPCIPKHTATYWLTSRFPDSVVWVGDPLYEAAYMYVDWVRITEYDDPVLIGAVDDTRTDGEKGTDLGSGEIPKTDYIANGGFNQDFTVKSLKNETITSWTAENAVRSGRGAVISGGGRIYQNITSQYAGYNFELKVEGKVTGGAGKCKIYAEFLSGDVNTVTPVFSIEGAADIMEFDAACGNINKTARFTVAGGSRTQTVRVVVETEKGTTAEIKKISMFMV